MDNLRKKIFSFQIFKNSLNIYIVFSFHTVHEMGLQLLLSYILTQVSLCLTSGGWGASVLVVLYAAAHPSSYSGYSPKKILRKTQFNLNAVKQSVTFGK